MSVDSPIWSRSVSAPGRVRPPVSLPVFTSCACASELDRVKLARRGPSVAGAPERVCDRAHTPWRRHVVRQNRPPSWATRTTRGARRCRRARRARSQLARRQERPRRTTSTPRRRWGGEPSTSRPSTRRHLLALAGHQGVRFAPPGKFLGILARWTGGRRKGSGPRARPKHALLRKRSGSARPI